MIRIAHITDVHLPLAGASLRELASKRILGWLSWRLRRHRRHRIACLNAIIEDIRTHAPDHVVITGDLVNISTRKEFAAARFWLESLASPEHLTFIPGNHDRYVAEAEKAGLLALSPWMTAQATEPDKKPHFPCVRYLGNVAIISLDSTYPAPWGEASGRLGFDQIERLASLLDETRSKGLFRLVLIHHPPLFSLATSPRKALKDGDALEQILREKGAEAVLYGHNHLWKRDLLETRTGPAHLLAAPSASYRPGGKKPAAGWQMLGIIRRQGAWQLHLLRRGLNREGRPVTLFDDWLRT